jgi:hypothetical protein
VSFQIFPAHPPFCIDKYFLEFYFYFQNCDLVIEINLQFLIQVYLLNQFQLLQKLKLRVTISLYLLPFWAESFHGTTSIVNRNIFLFDHFLFNFDVILKKKMNSDFESDRCITVRINQRVEFDICCVGSVKVYFT